MLGKFGISMMAAGILLVAGGCSATSSGGYTASANDASNGQLVAGDSLGDRVFAGDPAARPSNVAQQDTTLNLAGLDTGDK